MKDIRFGLHLLECIKADRKDNKLREDSHLDKPELRANYTSNV